MTVMQASDADPKGLVRESYRIEGITLEECRSVFIDWALSLPEGTSVPEAIEALLALYDTDDPDHPMGAVLREGLVTGPEPRRRGGRAARLAKG
jgi:hypothetical protein